MVKTHLSASLLAADPLRLYDEASAALEAGADSLHIDIMDHHYVPHLGLNPGICQALRTQGIQAPLHVHLMTLSTCTAALIPFCAQVGANSIVFHPETDPHLDRTLSLIRSHGCLAGLALNPSTPLSCLDYIWEQCDLILLMSVNPGFSGQTWIPGVLQKIQALKEYKPRSTHSPEIIIDGGINAKHAGLCVKAGAHGLVLGSCLFSSKDYAHTIRAIQEACQD